LSGVATLLCLALPYGFVIWLPAAGFVAVYLFSRPDGPIPFGAQWRSHGVDRRHPEFCDRDLSYLRSSLCCRQHAGGLDPLREQL
jgi:hypothetical protein